MAFLKPKDKSYCFWSHTSSGSMKISERLRQLRITHGDPIHRGILQYKYCECEYIIKSLLITHWHPLNSVQGNQAIQNLKILAQFDQHLFYRFTCKPCNKPPQGSSVCPFRSSGRMVPLAEPALSVRFWKKRKWNNDFRTLELNIQPYWTIGNAKNHCVQSVGHGWFTCFLSHPSTVRTWANDLGIRSNQNDLGRQRIYSDPALSWLGRPLHHQISHESSHIIHIPSPWFKTLARIFLSSTYIQGPLQPNSSTSQ